jgi:hypothetical protein
VIAAFLAVVSLRVGRHDRRSLKPNDCTTPPRAPPIVLFAPEGANYNADDKSDQQKKPPSTIAFRELSSEQVSRSQRGINLTHRLHPISERVNAAVLDVRQVRATSRRRA